MANHVLAIKNSGSRVWWLIIWNPSTQEVEQEGQGFKVIARLRPACAMGDLLSRNRTEQTASVSMAVEAVLIFPSRYT